jgi:hypothetical protein
MGIAELNIATPETTPHSGSREVVWGAGSIAKAINRTERAVFHMLESGRLPGAKKISGRWCFVPSIFFSMMAETPSSGSA